jgi:ATP-dependent Clp protease adaptor protein ClpS
MENDVITADPEEKVENKHYPKWNVILHDDDFTPMDFVVDMLMQHFGHAEDKAMAIMFIVHTRGKGIAGSYTRDIAETKAAIVMHHARGADHPLLASIEPTE